MCEIFSKLTTKIRETPRSRVFIVNFERISDLFPVFMLFVDFQQLNVSWDTHFLVVLYLYFRTI